MVPPTDVDCTLRLGPPGVQEDVGPAGAGNAIEQALHGGANWIPTPRDRISNILFMQHHTVAPPEVVTQLMDLKTVIIYRMSQLDPDPFWNEQRDRLIGQSIVHPLVWEYKTETLLRKCNELHGENAINSHLYEALIRVKKYFYLTGRLV